MLGRSRGKEGRVHRRKTHVGHMCPRTTRTEMEARKTEKQSAYRTDRVTQRAEKPHMRMHRQTVRRGDRHGDNQGGERDETIRSQRETETGRQGGSEGWPEGERKAEHPGEGATPAGQCRDTQREGRAPGGHKARPSWMLSDP